MSSENHILLPAWFSERMMSDCWSFGLLLLTGDTICIKQITNISQAADGGLWLDVIMMDAKPVYGFGGNLLVSPTSRSKASINASHIVVAVELSDT